MEEIKKVITVDTSKGVKSIKSLKDEVSKLTDELENLEIGSKEYVDKLDDLVDAQKDLTAVTESMEGRTVNALKAFDSINQVAGGLAAGISAVSATFTLFGKDTEELDKVMVKLQASIAIVQGIGGLKGLGEGIINATKAFRALSVSIVATGTATKGAAVAMRGLKAALVSTGIGALVVAVGFLIEKLLTLKSTAKDAFDALEEEQKRQSIFVDELGKLVGNSQEFIEFKRDARLAAGLDEEYNILKQYYDDVIDLNQKVQKEIGNYKNRFIEGLSEISDESKKSRKAFASITEGVDFSDPKQLDSFLFQFKHKINEYSVLVESLNESQQEALEALIESFIKSDTAYNDAERNIFQAKRDWFIKEQGYEKQEREAIKAENEREEEEERQHIENLQNIRQEGINQANDTLDTNPFKDLKAKWQPYYDALSELYEKGKIDVKTYNETLLKYNEAYTKDYLDVSTERYKTDLENQLAYLQEMQSRESTLFDNQLANLSNEYQGQQRTKV